MRGTALFRFGRFTQAYPDLEFVEEKGSPERAQAASRLAKPIREASKNGDYTINRPVLFQSSLEPGSDPIGRLGTGDSVHLVSLSGGWAKVEVAAKRGVLTGYVPESVLSLKVALPE